MTPKAIATFLILVALATAGAYPASAQGRGVTGGGFDGRGRDGFEGGNFRRGGIDGGHGQDFHRRSIGGYAIFDGYGYGNSGYGYNGYGYGNGNGGYGDWYGISSGYDECPLFRQRVKTPNGWGVRMIPIC
jgi:heterogeneous nuclear ribonucleoprotein A1/A3